MQVKVVLLEGGIVPRKAHYNDAGFELFSAEQITLYPQQTVKIKTGVCLEIPDGYCGVIHDRSSMGSKSLKVMGGVIDSTYRGEIIVCLYNGGLETEIKSGDKIAQLLVLPVPDVTITEVDSLSETRRGTKGFGSTDQTKHENLGPGLTFDDARSWGSWYKEAEQNKLDNPCTP